MEVCKNVKKPNTRHTKLVDNIPPGSAKRGQNAWGKSRLLPVLVFIEENYRHD